MKPNVNVRNREVGWVAGFIRGNGGAKSHGTAGALGAGALAGFGIVQTSFAITGGAITMFIGTPGSYVQVASQRIANTHDTHAPYVEIFAHLRSAGDVDLPGRVHLYFNEYPDPLDSGLGDWVTGTFQAWEAWSPLTIPTPPPNDSSTIFSSAGPLGTRYEYRRQLGRVPGNLLTLNFTNLGSVAAAEWALGVVFRSTPPTVNL